MVRHLYTKQSHVPLLEVLQQIRERMEAIAKGIVSDHWSLHCIYDSNWRGTKLLTLLHLRQ